MKKLVLITGILSVLLSAGYSQTGWVIQSPFTSRNLNSFSITAVHNLYLGSDSGIVFKSSDYGVNWSLFSQDTAVKRFAIRFVLGQNNDDFNAVGDSAAYISKSGSQVSCIRIVTGTNQPKPNLKAYSYLQGCCSYEANVVAGDGGNFYINDLYPWRTDTDATVLAAGRRINSSSGIIFVGDNGLIMKADSIGIIRPNGERIKWRVIPGVTSQNLYCVNVISSGLCLAGGAGGIILKSTDFGETWVSIPSPTTENLYSITIGYSTLACGANGTIIRCITNDNWFSQTTPTAQNLRSIITITYTDFLSIGDNGVILRTTDGGGPPQGVIPISNEAPNGYKLEQNYPNPFNPATVIEFSVPENGEISRNVTLRIFDALGRETSCLVNEPLRPGSYKVSFDGSGFASGIYFYRLEVTSLENTKRTALMKKMVLIK